MRGSESSASIRVRVKPISAESNVPSWAPMSLIANPLTSAVRTDVVVSELYDGQTIKKSLGSDLRKRLFSVVGAESLDDAIEAEDLPALGDQHPLATYLRVVGKEAERLIGNTWKVTVDYDYPNLMNVVMQTPRVRWSIGSTSQKWEVDLDGFTIGSPYLMKKVGSNYVSTGELDDKCELGATVNVPTIQFSVEMPGSQSFDILANSAYWNCTNRSSFFQLPPGTVEYLGPTSDQIGPVDYKVVHNFQASWILIPPRFQSDAGGTYVGLKYAIWFYFGKDADGKRAALGLMKARVKNDADFDNLLVVT